MDFPSRRRSSPPNRRPPDSATRREALRSLSVLALGSVVATGAGSAGAGATGGASAGVGATGAGSTVAQDDAFDPETHGFGFRNWSTAVPTYPEHHHDVVTEAQVERAIRADWEDPFAETLGLQVASFTDRLVRTIARQVYVSANQFSATNGHCYGMVFAAQQYYERPETIPEGYAVASEIDHPSVPLSDPDHQPVGEEIDLFQVLQILDPNSWLGRRAMVRPRWIDLSMQAQNVAAVVDSFGTAGITLVDAESGASHQVLVYDYERSGGRTRFHVYDPNTSAWVYGRGHRPTVVVNGEEMTPYGRYTTFVFNRRDRVTASRSGAVGPAPALDRTAEELADLFRVALFLVDSPDVCLAVVDPDGQQVVRDEATFMDRANTPYHSMRYRYDAPAGEYHVALTSREDTDYTLTVEAADLDREIVAAEITGSLAAGETHEYTVELPGSGDGTVDLEEELSPWAYAAGGAAVGAAAVGVGTYASRRGASEDGE